MIALYALLLQTFFVLASPVPVPDHDGGVFCAKHSASTPAHDQADARCHACCAAMDVDDIAPPPVSVHFTPLPVLQRARVIWRPEAEIDRTGPPVRAQSARGPPFA
ncbi:hypothetical protein [Methylobacterium fujisawaense]|uniref:hypothetical protein n=1 Tax=Methylobacterium fujisawaense TaxID=107400 RepID=UPI0036F7F574